jgi:phage terminase small subunit
MKKSTLTPKQEKFVQALVAGKVSQREAYRGAYSSDRMLDKTVDEKASRLFAQDKIRARYDELVAEAASRAVYDRERLIADLTEIVETGMAHVRRTKAHEANFDDKGKREIADLPRGASTVISAMEKLDKLLRISEGEAGSGVPVFIDDFAEPDR